MLNSGAAYTVYGGQQTDYPCAEPETKHPVSESGYANNSVHTAVRCPKGEFEQDGKTYTAKIESYIDDQLISTSYAMWKDAPIMLLYKSDKSTTWAVQVTDIENQQAGHGAYVPRRCRRTDSAADRGGNLGAIQRHARHPRLHASRRQRADPRRLGGLPAGFCSCRKAATPGSLTPTRPA